MQHVATIRDDSGIDTPQRRDRVGRHNGELHTDRETGREIERETQRERQRERERQRDRERETERQRDREGITAHWVHTRLINDKSTTSILSDPFPVSAHVSMLCHRLFQINILSIYLVTDTGGVLLLTAGSWR